MARKVKKLKTTFSSWSTSERLNFCVKNITKKIILFLIILLTGLVAFKGLNNKPHDDEITFFLENLMIREGGLYTLVGTKPITIFKVHPEAPKPSSIDDKTYSKDRLNQSSEDSSNHAVLKHLKYDTLWKAWEKETIPVNPYNYMIVTRKSSYSDRLIGVFVNVPNTTYTLSSNYEIFSKGTKLNFDPSTIITEIGSDSSEFWKKVFQNHYLLGLLLGYGKQNSFIFDWLHSIPNDFQNIATQRQNEDPMKVASLKHKKKIKVQDLILPQFCYFNIHDEKIAVYRKERELIVKEFKKSQFKQKVLAYLCSESAK